MTLWLALIAPIALAADHPCDAAYTDACVDPSTTVDANATVGTHARIGPDMDIGNAVIGARAILDGREDGPLAQPVGDGTVIGRRAVIGPDADIGQDVDVGRAVSTGADFTAANNTSVGYGSTLGSGVSLTSGAAVGSLVTIGDDVTVSGVVARSASIGAGSTVSGVVGPNTVVGADAVVDGIIRKDVQIGDGAQIAATARVGRDATIGLGAVVPSGARVRAGATIPVCAELQPNEQVSRNEEWEGPSVSGCYDPEGWVAYATTNDVSGSSQVFDLVQDDATGDLYVAGIFQHQATIQDTVITGNSEYGTFLASYDEQGDLRWVKTWVDAGQIDVPRVAFANGALYLSARFRDDVSLDGITFTNTDNSSDSFITRLNPADGSVMWARQIRTNTPSNGARVMDMVATSNSVYLVGFFATSLDLLGSGSRTLTTRGLGSNPDGYAARISSSGTWQWAGRVGGDSSEYLSSVAVAPNGNVVTGGYIASTTLTSGNDAFFSGSGQTNGGTFDALLMVLNTSGQRVTSRILNDTGNTYVRAVAVDPSGNVFAALGYHETVSIGGSTLNAGAAYEAAGIARFSSSLSPIQAWQPTGSMRVSIAGLEVTSSTATLAGYTSPSDGESLNFSGTTLTGRRGFVASLDRSTGSFTNVVASTDADSLAVYALAPYETNGISGHVTGGFLRGDVTFGSVSFQDTTRTNGFWLPVD